MREKALFFLRHYNDLDHVAPVIYKWVSSAGALAHVILVGRPELSEDYRIAFLRSLKGVCISQADEFLTPEGRRREEARQRGWLQAQQELEGLRLGKKRREHAESFVSSLPPYHPRRVARKCLRTFLSLARRKQERAAPFPPNLPPLDPYEPYDDADYVQALLSVLFPGGAGGVVAFDWITELSPARYVEFARKTVQACHRHHLPVVSLPHGDEPHYCRMTRLKELDYAAPDIYAPGAMFDCVVLPNELCRWRYERHISADRLKILGSPRYSAEWMEVLSKLLPRFEAPKAGEKLKCVMFLRSFQYPVFWEEVARTMEMIGKIPGVFLLVKHHTRDMRHPGQAGAYRAMHASVSGAVQMVGEGAHSGSLVRWADAVFDLGTSVTFEALRLGKAVLSMEYLHATHTTIAHFLPGTAMHCRDHVYDAVDSLRKDRSVRLYDQAERERFLREMIDVPDGDVLSRYVGLLERFLRSG